MMHVHFERDASGQLVRVETPDERTGSPTAYDRALDAARQAPPEPVPTATKADRDNMARMQRERAAAVATPLPVQVDPFVHTSTERRADKIIVTRTRRDGSKATYETAVPAARPVTERAPALSYEERLRRVRAEMP